MDANINNFVTWLQGHEDEFPPFSNELIDTTAKASRGGWLFKGQGGHNQL